MSARSVRDGRWAAAGVLVCLAGGGLGLGLGMGGCAVTTIDVDIYKGPLANEEEVQRQQAAMLAIGAKPLLKQFRDRRETEYRRYDRFLFLWNSTELRDCSKLYPNAIPDDVYFFQDKVAARANRILSLYDDRPSDAELSTHVLRIKRLAQEYAGAREILRPQGDRWSAERKELAGKLGLSAKDLLAEDGGVDLEGGMLPPEGEVGPASPFFRESKARAAYYELLLPRTINGRSLFYEQRIMADAAAQAPHDPRIDKAMVPGRSGEFYSDESFDLLADPAWVRADVLRLFPTLDEETREQLVEEVVKTAVAFTRTRAQLEDLLEESLVLGIGVNASNSPLTEPAAKRATRVVSELVSALISRRFADEAVRVARNAAGSDRDPGAPLWLEPPARKESRLASMSDNGAGASLAKLRDLIVEHPSEVLGDLRRLHDSVSRVRPHGIAAGPVVRVDAKALSPSNIELLAALVSREVASAPFARGRLDKGIDSLTDEFVRLGSTGRKDNADVELLDTLTQFAEKTLYLANYSQLVDVEPSFVTDPVEWVKAKDLQRGDAQIFEAVGNSIIVQVNELYAKKNWTKRQERIAPLLARAEPAAAGEGGRSKTEPPTDPKELVDLILFQLQKSLREEIDLHGESDAAKRHRAAIAYVYEQRSRLVYIRPPSFFLKNSYPVSSLQDNPSQGPWKNMLAQQAWRSTPFLGELTAHSSEERDQIRTQQKIDRQFWQNINRVRVAGVGKTSYVIAKDPIGNWYVKTYETDPEPIIKAAKAAALLAAGAPSVYEAAGKAIQKAGEGAAVQKGTVDRQFESLEKQYKDRTQKDTDRVKALVTLFRRLIKDDAKELLGANNLAAATPNDVSNLTEGRFGAFPESGTPATDDTDATGEQDRADRAIAKTLNELERARRDFLGIVATATKTNGDAGDEAKQREAAKRSLDAKLRLSDAVDARLATLDWYRSTLATVVDLVNPPASRAAAAAK